MITRAPHGLNGMERQTTRNAALARLDALVGTWDMTAVIQGAEMSGASCSFEWIEEGAFLVMHADAALPPELPPEFRDNWPYPVVVVIGLDARTDTYSYAYADARPVHRVYTMSFDGTDWRIWGQAGPEFFQRFFGTVSDDGNRIDARWEISPDGESWELDFELTYTRR
jgi:hypothetical protein